MSGRRRKKSSNEIPIWGWWVIGGFLLMLISPVLWIVKGPAAGLLPLIVVVVLALLRRAIRFLWHTKTLSEERKSSMAALQSDQEGHEARMGPEVEIGNVAPTPRTEQSTRPFLDLTCRLRGLSTKVIHAKGRWVIGGFLGLFVAAVYMCSTNGPSDYGLEYRLLTEKMKESAQRLGDCKGVTAKLEARRPPAGDPLDQWIENSGPEYLVSLYLISSVAEDLEDVEKRLNRGSRPPRELAEGRKLLREMLDELEKILSLISTRDEGGMTCVYFRGTDRDFLNSMQVCSEKFMQLDRMLPRTSYIPKD